MKTFCYTVTDELGIHARPAGLLVKEAKKYGSTIKITKGEKVVSASQLLMVMSLGIKKGDTVTITVDGIDENEAYTAMETFFHNL